jgi:hypothetical protein
MAGKELKYSNDMKYLGITLNKRLSFTNHLNEKMRKVGYLQNKINQIIGQEWGLTPGKSTLGAYGNNKAENYVRQHRLGKRTHQDSN